MTHHFSVKTIHAIGFTLGLSALIFASSPTYAQDQDPVVAPNQNAPAQDQDLNQQFNQGPTQNQIQGAGEGRMPNGADSPGQPYPNEDLKNAAPENPFPNAQAPSMPVDQN